MILRFEQEKFLFYINPKHIEEVLSKLKKCEGLTNIKNLEIHSIQTDKEEIKNYCKNNGISVCYGFDESIFVSYDLFIDDKKLKKLCENNDFKYDESIKYLDNHNTKNDKEEELDCFIFTVLYDELISDDVISIEDLISEFDEE